MGRISINSCYYKLHFCDLFTYPRQTGSSPDPLLLKKKGSDEVSNRLVSFWMGYIKFKKNLLSLGQTKQFYSSPDPFS